MSLLHDKLIFVFVYFIIFADDKGNSFSQQSETD